MTHSAGQIVLYFVGAGLVSVVLICLLNAEANSRKVNREPEIVNGNLFSALGHQVKRLVRRWALDDLPSNQSQVEDDLAFRREQQAREQQALDQSQARQGQQDRSGSAMLWGPRRRLTSLEAGSTQQPHSMRHARHKNKTTTTTTTTAASERRQEELDLSTEPTLRQADVARQQPSGGGGGGVKHEQCFSTHEVLWIITITCGVNFTFVFLVLTCVRILGQTNSMESAFDNEQHKSLTRLCPSESYNSVQEYVDSLPDTISVRRSHHQLGTAFSMEDLLFV